MSVKELVEGWTRTEISGINFSRYAKWIALGGAATAVVYLVLTPLVFLIWTSFWSSSPGDFTGELTLENYLITYLSADTFQLFLNSLFVAIGTVVVAISVGFLFAWLITRTNLPTKSWIEIVILSPYAIPRFLFALMFIFTYGPELGFVTRFLMRVFGWQSPPFNIYSYWGIIVVLGLTSVTTAYLLFVPALNTIDPALEESGRIHGASMIQTVRSITLPLNAPVVLSATLLTFIYALGEFQVVAMLGLPTQYHVYATKIWAATSFNVPPEYGYASALSMSLLFVTFIFVWYYRKATTRKEDYMTVTGSGYQQKQWDLGWYRWPLAGILWIFLFFIWIAPILILIIVSFHESWSGATLVEISKLTIDNYIRLMEEPEIIRSIWNTFVIGTVGAIIGTALVTLSAYYTERTQYPFRNVVDFLSLTPLAVPGVILGGGVLFTYLWVGKLHSILNIYGTLWIITVGLITVYLPVVSRMAVGNMVQIHTELEESARILGASWIGQMREVFLPLFKKPLAVIFFYLFVHMFRNLTIPIMTYTEETKPVSVIIFNLWRGPAAIETLSALSVVFISILLLVLFIMRALGMQFHE